MGTLKKAAMLFAAFTLLSITSIFAATGWTRVDYTSSTTFIGYILEADGYVTGAQPGDSIGAFVEGECRMKAKLFYAPTNDTLFVSSVIHGGGINPPNDPSPVSNVGETVTFKIWRANGDVVEDLAGSTITEPAGDIYMYPLGKTDVVISDDATLATIEVANVTIAPTFDAATTEYTAELGNGSALPAEGDYTVTTADANATVAIDYATDFLTDASTVITVTAEDGTTEIVYTITYTELNCAVAKPTVDPTETICAGETTTLAASGEATATFEWKNATGDVVSSDAALGTKDAGTYTVTQTVGCKGLSATVDITVTPLPVITVATVNALSNPVCSSSSVSLDGVATPAGGEYSGTGVTGDATNGFELTSSVAGDVVYSIEVDGCSAEKTIAYTVVDAPTAALTGLPTAVCSSDVEFDLSGGTPANGIYSIGGNTVTSFDPALYTGAVEITYTASTAVGCEDVATASITVNTAPAKLAVEDQVVVLPATVQAFTVTPENGATVTWYNEAGEVIAGANESYTPTETLADVYTYTVTQKIGDCESMPTTVSLTITACSALKPTLDKTTETVCAGTAVSFTATPDTGSEIIWTDEQGNSVVATNNTITPTTDADGTFIFFASQQSTAANSCESPQAKVTLVVNKVPEVSITVPSTPLTVSSDAVEILVSPATATLTGTGITTNNMFDPATAGVGTHTLTATITTLGCEGSDTKDIIVSSDVVSNEALLAAIATAEDLTATTGYAKDEYIDPTDANTALATAIAAAKAVTTSTDAAELAAATTAMNNAITAFNAAANPIDYTALKAALDAADEMIVTIGTNVGTEAGQYKTAEVSDLTTAITNGKTLYGTSNATVVATATADIIAKTAITPIPDVVVVDTDALKAALAAADALILTTTEGTATGEYATGSKAVLQAVIDAKDDFLTSTVQDDVNTATAAVNKAIEDYKLKVNSSVDTQALKAAIAAATEAEAAAVKGYAITQYVEANLVSAKAALDAAIKTAQDALTGVSTTEEVVAATQAMTTATAAFQAAANQVDYSDLATAIANAEAKVGTIGTNIGTGADQYSTVDVNALNTAILDAKALFTETNTATIATMISDLEAKTAITVNGSVTIDYQALETAITAAETVYDAAVVGTNDGEYTQADKDALLVAIDAAKALRTSTDQAAVTAGAGTLDAAVVTFKATVITITLDVTDLEDAIKLAQETLDAHPFGANTGNVSLETYLALDGAIDDAKAALLSVSSASGVASETKTLEDAIDLFLLGVITSVDANEASVSFYPTIVTESLTIEGIESEASISIVSSTGVAVFDAQTSADQVIIPVSELTSGLNIITVTLSDGSIVTGKVTVQ